MSTKRNWDLLTDDQRKIGIEAVIAHFAMERDEQIGIIAGGEVLDAVLESCSGFMYDKGLEDAKAVAANKAADLNYEIDALRRVI